MLIPLTLLALLVLAATLVLAAFLFYVYWWQIQRPVPRLEGDLRLSCLDATVEVLRDRHGVPSLYAQTDADLFRAQGFIHAQDRLWQMEQSRRTANGTLAEVFGEGALEADRFSRLVGFRRCAEAELEALDQHTRNAIEWYCQGVNEYLQIRPGKLAAEFNLLRCRPEPWTALDTVAHWKATAWGLSANWESEMVSWLLVNTLGPERSSELIPDYPSDGPRILGLGDSAIAEVSELANRLIDGYERVKPWLGVKGEARGSSTWAIAPRRSATRRAIVASDSHLAVQIPSSWYEVRLSSPSYEVGGVSLPGMPGILIGHNESIAWGFSAALCDVQDLYVERSRPGEPSRLAAGDGWYQAQEVTEEIQVRGWGSPHVEIVRLSRSGPIISDFAGNGLQKSEQICLSLRWAGHEAGHTLMSVLTLNRAHDWDAFREASFQWSVPPQNMVYADRDGNIGYVLAGSIPIRRDGGGTFPSPGWEAGNDWQGYILPDQLPNVLNPDEGYIVAANNRIVGHDFRPYVGGDYCPGWRAKRIVDLLEDKERHTLRDVAEMQSDTGSWLARKLAPWIGQLAPKDSYERVAAELLRKWDYMMEPDSTAATVFHYACLALLDEAYGDKLGEAYAAYVGLSRYPFQRNSGRRLQPLLALLDLVDRHPESPWYHDTESGQDRSRNQVLGAALASAVRQLRKELGDNARRWEWARVHQVRFAHPVGRTRLLRPFFNRGPYPLGGDLTTPLQTGGSPTLPPGLVEIIPAHRHIFDVGNWDAGLSVVATGQSGHPLSPYYADQIDMWREGEYHPFPWSRSEVESAAIHRLTLSSNGAPPGPP